MPAGPEAAPAKVAKPTELLVAAPAPVPKVASVVVTPPAPAPAAPADPTGFHPELDGAEFVPGLRLRPGDVLSYALRFVNRGSEPAERNQPVFVHFEPAGQDCSAIAFQQDHELRLSTDMWQPGELVLDGPRLVEIPFETPPGKYQIHVGVFDRAGTGKRSFDQVVGTLEVDPAAPPSSSWRPEPAPQAELASARAALRARLRDPVVLDAPGWSFALDRKSGAWLLEDKQAQVCWSSNPDSESFGRVRWKKGERSLDLAIERFDSIEREGTALVGKRALGAHGGLGSLELRAERSPGTSGLRMTFTARPPEGWELETLMPLERAFMTTDADEGCTLAPNWLGQLKPADSGLPCDRWYGGDDVSMAMSGAVKQGAALMLAWLERDASLVMHASLEHSALVAGRRAQSLSLVFGPRARTLEIMPLGKGGYAEIGAAYKQVAQLRGLRKPWTEKRAANPELVKLEGAPEFRFSGLSRFAPGTRHNQSDESLVRLDTTFAQAERCVKHWREDLGLERAQILFSGWNRGGYDNGHPDVLPANAECGGNAGLQALSHSAQEHGYVFTLHDNYADIYPDSPSWDEQRVVRGPDGALKQGGEWLGGRAWRVCGSSQLFFAQRNLPELERLFHPQAIFLDSTLTCPLQTCYDAQHPMQWWQDQERRLELFGYARGVIGLVGLEGGREWAVPEVHWFEGMLTQKTVHRRDWIIAPVFLFAFGDCIELLPMQADKLRPRDARKLLDLALCGQMPSYAFGPQAYFEEAQTEALPVVPEAGPFQSRDTREFRLALHWKVLGDLSEDYRVFVHFVRPGAKNREGIVFQADHDTPVPTSKWRAGDSRVSGALPVRLPPSESEEEQWEVRVGLARNGVRRVLAAPDGDDGMVTVGMLRRGNDALSFEPATRTADSCFARGDGGWAQGLSSTDRMIKNSYEVLTWLNRLAITRGMTGHRFLAADRSVEESRFGDCVVTANFGEREFVVGETSLPQFGFLIESPGFVAFHATRRGTREYAGGALFTLRALDGGALAKARQIRVFHAFGPEGIDVEGRSFEVRREVLVDGPASR